MVTCTGHIGIHEGADVRTDGRDVMAIKPNFSYRWVTYFLKYGAKLVIFALKFHVNALVPPTTILLDVTTVRTYVRPPLHVCQCDQNHASLQHTSLILDIHVLIN